MMATSSLSFIFQSVTSQVWRLQHPGRSLSSARLVRRYKQKMIVRRMIRISPLVRFQLRP